MNLQQCLVGLVVSAALFGCQSRPSPPWKLLAIGTEPVDSALARGEAICAWDPLDAAWPVLLYAGDAAVLDSLPDILCGDQMTVLPTDLPKRLRQHMQWEGGDSLNLTWQCLGRQALAHMGADIVSKAARPALAEQMWRQALERTMPGTYEPPMAPFAWGDTVTLTITCERPDGRAVGDTVRLSFLKGEPDQVVPALEAGLSQAGPGARWATWALSSDAFGSGAHPDLGLAPFTPLFFRAEAQ